MTEYITKEQAISVVTASTDYDEGWLVEDIEALPAADVVEVVRCDDCKHRVVDEILLSFTSVPETAWVCDIGITACLSDFYCGRGERMDGDCK